MRRPADPLEKAGGAYGGRCLGPGHRAVTDRRLEMTLLIFLALLLALDLVAWRWGHDSRDGRDWTS